MALIGSLTRAQIASATVLPVTFQVSGYSTHGDLGTGAIYTSVGAGSTGPMAIQNASGVWYQLVLSGTYNVGWFGAVGDGSTDDGPAIRLCVKTAYTLATLNNPGVTIFFPAGLFMVKLSGGSTNIFGGITTINAAPRGGTVGFNFVGTGRYSSRLRMDTTGSAALPAVNSIALSGTVATVTFASSVTSLLAIGNTIAISGVTGTGLTYFNTNWVLAGVSGSQATFNCTYTGTPAGSPVATVVNYLVNPPETFSSIGDASFIDLGFEGGPPDSTGSWSGAAYIPYYATAIFRFYGVNTSGGNTPYNVQNSNIRFERVVARAAQLIFDIAPATIGQLTSEFHHSQCNYSYWAVACYQNNNPQAVNHSMNNCDIQSGFGHVFNLGGGNLYYDTGSIIIGQDAGAVTSASVATGTVTLVLPASPLGVIVGSSIVVNATTNGGTFTVTAVTYNGNTSTIQYSNASAPTGTITVSLIASNAYVFFGNSLGGFNPSKIENARMELHGNYSCLSYLTASKVTRVVFSHCYVLDFTLVNKTNWIYNSVYSRSDFQYCYIVQNGSGLGPVTYNMPVVQYNHSNQVGESGTITFVGCSLPQDWSDQCSVDFYGSITADQCSTNYPLTSPNGAAVDFTMNGIWPKGVYTSWGTTKVSGDVNFGSVQPKTRFVRLKSAGQYWPMSTGTELSVKLPRYAQIKAIHIRYPGGAQYTGTFTTNPSFLRVTDSTYAVVHAYISIADGTTAASFDGSAGTLTTNDWYMYNVSTATADRTLTLSVGPSTGGSSNYTGISARGGGGEVWIEYW